MYDKPSEELMVRWMDGETLTPEEHDALKQTHKDDPGKLINLGELKRIQSAIQSTYTSEIPIPNADQFQDSLMKKIAQEQSAESTSDSKPNNVESFPAQKVKRKNWLLNAAAMAACFLLGLLINMAFLNKSTTSAIPIAQVTEHSEKLQPVVYTAYDNLSVGFLSNDETNVIIVEGLDAIPDDIDLFALAEAHKHQPIRVQPQISYPEHEN